MCFTTCALHKQIFAGGIVVIHSNITNSILQTTSLSRCISKCPYSEELL